MSTSEVLYPKDAEARTEGIQAIEVVTPRTMARKPTIAPGQAMA
jgi:hypothetical protein